MKYYEDFSPGRIETIGEHLLSEKEIIDFAAVWDPQPMHTDREAASHSPFGGLIASGVHLLAICVRVIITKGHPVATIAAMGLDNVKFLEPARPSDRLTVTRECLEKRTSSSKKDRGIVRSRIRLVNQVNRVIFEYTDTMLVAKEHDTNLDR